MTFISAATSNSARAEKSASIAKQDFVSKYAFGKTGQSLFHHMILLRARH